MQQTKSQTPERIEKSFMSLMAEVPLSDISIQMICKKAGASVGSFYHFFSSKDELLIRSIARMRTDTAEHVRRCLKGNAVDKLKTYLYCAYEYFASSGLQMQRALTIANVRTGHALEEYSETHLFGLLEEILRSGQEEGTIRKDISANTLADILYNMMTGHVEYWVSSNGAFSLTELLSKKTDEVIRLVSA